MGSRPQGPGSLGPSGRKDPPTWASVTLPTVKPDGLKDWAAVSSESVGKGGIPTWEIQLCKRGTFDLGLEEKFFTETAPTRRLIASVYL